MWLFDTHIHCGMITAIKITIHTHHLTWLALFLCGVRMPKIIFEVCDTTLLTLVTMLYLRFSELVFLMRFQLSLSWSSSGFLPYFLLP